MFFKFPYVDMYTLNLDWMIKYLEETKASLEEWQTIIDSLGTIVHSVNGQTGNVNLGTLVNSVNGQTGNVNLGTLVNSVNGKTGDVEIDNDDINALKIELVLQTTDPVSTFTPAVVRPLFNSGIRFIIINNKEFYSITEAGAMIRFNPFEDLNISKELAQPPANQAEIEALYNQGIRFIRYATADLIKHYALEKINSVIVAYDLDGTNGANLFNFIDSNETIADYSTTTLQSMYNSGVRILFQDETNGIRKFYALLGNEVDGYTGYTEYDPVSYFDEQWVPSLQQDLSSLKSALESVLDVTGAEDLKSKTAYNYPGRDTGYYINADGSLTGSSSWTSYLLDADIYEIIRIKAFTNNASTPCVAFYTSLEPSSSTFIEAATAVEGENEYFNPVLPSGTKGIIVCNRTETFASPVVYGYENNGELGKLDTRIDGLNDELEYAFNKQNENIISNYYYGTYYINDSHELKSSSSWYAYLVKADDFDKITASLYTNNAGYYAFGFYSGLPSDSNWVTGGIEFTDTGKQNFIVNKSQFPSTATYILICNRKASGTDITITGEYSGFIRDVKTLKADVAGLSSSGNVKAIYKNIENSNDFVIIKDEIWFAEVVNAETDKTTVHRYRINDGVLSKIGDIDTDFGHWNSVDYCEENDCLIFGNGGNDTSTVGNFFSVIKNPLALGSTATLANCSIRYDVDIGYKVQAIWGSDNVGKNNLVYLISNSLRNVYTVLLSMTDGEFDGNFKIVDSHTYESGYIVGGADFWGNTMYVGIGDGYRIAKVNVSDYSVSVMTRPFYDDYGNARVGATQGVCVDSNYIWVFSNVGSQYQTDGLKNFLIQYYR